MARIHPPRSSSPSVEFPQSLLNIAAKLRKEAQDLRLTFPEKQALLAQAQELERRAASMSGPHDPPPPPGPPVWPTKAEFERYLQYAGYADEKWTGWQGRSAATAAEWALNAKGWRELATGIVPPGWTRDGPPKCPEPVPVGGSQGPPMGATKLSDLQMHIKCVCFCGHRKTFRTSALIEQLGLLVTLDNVKQRLSCTSCGHKRSAVFDLP